MTFSERYAEDRAMGGAVTPVTGTFNPHGNRTSDGVLITVGMRVTDYDRRTGIVVADNDRDSYRCCQSTYHERRNDLREDRTGCDAGCRHDHWFEVQSSSGSKSFNGSRLESRS